MFRRPGPGRSKASADTLCQKCLKRGHYSYECKASTQERPYTSRPSRTQQLLNPKLKPKLTTDVPSDLLRKKGVADDILKKKEADRRRSRSLSTSSADSVSTISTNRSPSRSPPTRRRNDGPASRGRGDNALGKRARRSISMDSHSSEGLRDQDRNTRRRMSSFSPGERGRKRTRSRSTSVRMQTSHHDAPTRTSRSTSVSRARGARRPRSMSAKRQGKRPARRISVSRSRSRSLDRMDTSDDRNGAPRGRWGASPPAKARLTRSPSPYRGSRDRSPSLHSRRKASRRSPSPYATKNGDRSRDGPRGPGRNRFDNAPPANTGPPPARPAPPPVQRERSLSPYSKRLALTRQMQAG